MLHSASVSLCFKQCHFIWLGDCQFTFVICVIIITKEVFATSPWETNMWKRVMWGSHSPVNILCFLRSTDIFCSRPCLLQRAYGVNLTISEFIHRLRNMDRFAWVIHICLVIGRCLGKFQCDLCHYAINLHDERMNTHYVSGYNVKHKVKIQHCTIFEVHLFNHLPCCQPAEYR